MTSNPYESPDSADKLPVRESLPNGGLKLIHVLAFLAVLGIVAVFLLPNVRNARGAARRAQCANNLKLIGLALHNYADKYHALPPAYTVDAEGKPLHSWRTLILPYLEQQTLYEKIDLTKPWDDPVNKAAYDTVIDGYGCPSVIKIPPAHTTYLAVVGPNACFQPTQSRKLSEIGDGTSSTLMVIDVDAAHGVHWMSPNDASEELILKLGSSPNLSHPGGIQALLADGTSRFFSADMDASKLRAVISIDVHDQANITD